MGLKPDHWIRKMAQEHGMIEPFVDSQVRQGVISYGVSSYGYDIRVADEFKIFTNVFSAIVDPKAFDTRSMVDFQGDVCIIPPNSFALARTVEYFRIPRNVLTICLGKSTYARCFRGDTRVALADGSTPTLEEMARRAETGDTFRGYSVDPSGRIIKTELIAPRYIGRDHLLELVLDSGDTIFCTDDHRFLTSAGQMVEAHELRPGSRLMSLPRRETPRPYGSQEAAPVALSMAGQVQGAALPAQVLERTLLRSLSKGPHVGVRKIRSIREVPGDHDVYCLTVPETGNFALAAGVFVSNCGIIVNVTPFEPEWEGFVTLEISNTTPLPAKIYANEGLAQVLFFEADEECEVSYADKKGKYQGQQSIVLPKL